MKHLVVIVSASVREAVIDQLRALKVTGFTLSVVEGHGPRTAEDPFLSSRDRVVGYVPQVRIDMVLPPERVAAVVDALSDPHVGLAGHGVFWLTAIERFDQF